MTYFIEDIARVASHNLRMHKRCCAVGTGKRTPKRGEKRHERYWIVEIECRIREIVEFIKRRLERKRNGKCFFNECIEEMQLIMTENEIGVFHLNAGLFVTEGGIYAPDHYF